MALILERDGRVLAVEVVWATSVWRRLRGLIGRPHPEGTALVLAPARQVHTFGMTVPIDVLFCSRDNSVLHVARSVSPRRVTRWVRRGRLVVELPAGAAAGVLRGDRLVFRPAGH